MTKVCQWHTRVHEAEETPHFTSLDSLEESYVMANKGEVQLYHKKKPQCEECTRLPKRCSKTLIQGNDCLMI